MSRGGGRNMQGAAKAGNATVSQLRETDTGKLGCLLRLANLVACGLALYIGGVWHLTEIVGCANATLPVTLRTPRL